jgi:catechol 2,3-dioxygenase-like lactoylglutathione lyase family enzyme
MTAATQGTSAKLLNHTDLYHVFLSATDVEGAMGELSRQLGVSWLPIMRGTYCAWVPGDEPVLEEATTVYSKEGPVYIELGHFPIKPMPKGTDLLTPQHFGYWCDDVPGTREALQAIGWVLEFEVGRPEEGPTAPYLRSPSGYLVELVPRSSKERFDAYARSGQERA